MLYHFLLAGVLIPLLMISWLGVQLLAHKGSKGCTELFRKECLSCFFKNKCDHTVSDNSKMEWVQHD
ncbi:MAG: hypothetical protein D6675_00150 [Gemmatimonadetes bacterium]|nr:MAG: hypothetical protein D6675_00150 [Gemmatimonadota bacterium]